MGGVLQNKVVIVTGGGSGVGAAAVRLFAEARGCIRKISCFIRGALHQ